MVHTRSQLKLQASESAPASQTSSLQRSLGTAQDSTVELNWLLFDKSRRTPVVIAIPRSLFEAPSQHCRPLFVQPLLREYHVATKAEDVMFWTVGGRSVCWCVASEPFQQTKNPLSIKDAASKGWTASINDLEDLFTLVLRPETFSDNLVVVDRKLVHLIITVRNEGLAIGQSVINAVPELKEFKRMSNSTYLSVADTSP